MSEIALIVSGTDITIIVIGLSGNIRVLTLTLDGQLPCHSLVEGPVTAMLEC